METRFETEKKHLEKKKISEIRKVKGKINKNWNLRMEEVNGNAKSQKPNKEICMYERKSEREYKRISVIR